MAVEDPQAETGKANSQKSATRRMPGGLFLVGVAVGAAAALVFSNRSARKAVLAGSVQAWGALQAGLEEAKEQVRDIEAELHDAMTKDSSEG